jgi:hypothetical protein
MVENDWRVRRFLAQRHRQQTCRPLSLSTLASFRAFSDASAA